MFPLVPETNLWPVIWALGTRLHLPPNNSLRSKHWQGQSCSTNGRAVEVPFSRPHGEGLW